ncbi:MAG: polyphosphate polymerase domain-containing protein [Oscillospiraceae bacterium]|nr:polyphosphate polymerase domain-containing protein [Oscillospiraceae bacterium]
MGYQSVFQRYELKYLLTRQQQETVLREMQPHMALDQYGKTVIRNVYYDTDNYLLIRRSIEKPAYKEKLRLRSYSQADSDTPVFVELKKKYDSVVYKRRLSMAEGQAMNWLRGEEIFSSTSQISREIDYFRDFYGSLRPTVFLSYERYAYYAKDGSDFRVTFDDRILCRETELSLTAPIYGASLLPEDMVLMEIKCSGGIPLWMTQLLSRERIYKTSFSKYGTAYRTLIYPKLKEKAYYAGKTV